MNDFTVYVLRGNRDQTEGRGPFVDREFYHDFDDAAQRVQSKDAMRQWGVMGVTDLYLVMRKFTMVDNSGVRMYEVSDTDLWGYRKDWRGVWGFGWMDNRDAPTEDPEYNTYLRLKEKFHDSP